MDKTILHYIPCLKCQEEWALFEEDGICDKCNSEVENDITILSLLDSTRKVSTFSKENIKKYKKQLQDVIHTLQSKLE